jgi:cytochrome c-type biogenesis protein CcmH
VSARPGALLVAFALLACIASARAADDAARAADARLEAQVHSVASELRCLVCQNQTLADSNAELAQDLRREVREMLARGQSEAEVRAFMTARYGDFILYRPPLKATTVALWAGPFVLLAAGLWGLARIARNRRRVAGEAELTPEQRARVQALLGAAEHEPQ